MSFHDVRMPTNLSWGLRSYAEHNVSVFRGPSGAKTRVNRWSNPIRHWNVKENVKSFAALRQLEAFFLPQEGSTHSWRFKDHFDHSSNPNHYVDSPAVPTISDVQLGIGDGSVTDFPLVKRYTDGVYTVVRNIMLPVVGSVVVGKDTGSGPVAQSTGWSLILQPGLASALIRFSSAPGSGDIISAGFEFDCHASLSEESSRQMEQSIDDFSGGSYPSDIIIDEEVDPVPIDDHFYYGDGTTQTWASGSLAYAFTMGRVVALLPTAGSLEFDLPSPSGYSRGGPHFELLNVSGTHAFDVTCIANGMTPVTVGTNSGCVVHCVDNGGTKVWRIGSYA